MRHHRAHRTFGRKRKVRVAFTRSLAEALIVREKILTTEARAKEIRSSVEKMITMAKSGSLSARRELTSRLGGRKALVKKLFDTIAPRYGDRKGGYTRVTKVAKRSSDGRSHAVIELV